MVLKTQITDSPILSVNFTKSKICVRICMLLLLGRNHLGVMDFALKPYFKPQVIFDEIEMDFK